MIQSIWKRTAFMMGVGMILMFTTIDASAQRGVRSDAGYVNLEALGNLDDLIGKKPSIEVNVEGALMKLVAEASRMEDPELADLLLKLRGVYVLGYDVSLADRDPVKERANLMGDRLVAQGWDSVVRVRDEDEHVQMFVRFVNDSVSGIVVMSIEKDSEETVFVNIVGDIDPAQIGRIGRKFNIGNVPEW